MMSPVQPNPPETGDTRSDRFAGRRLPLLGAIGLTIVAALILVYVLTAILNGRAEMPVVATSNAAPVPLSSQPISFLDQPTAVPELKFVNASDKPLSLADFRGRPVLLNIWATWCLPCRKEMPSLDRLQAKFDNTKLLVLTLSIDRGGAAVVRKFYADLGLKSLGIYVDQSGSALHQLGLLGIPGTILINSDGQEIGRKLGPAEWDHPEITAILRQRFGLTASAVSKGTAP